MAASNKALFDKFDTILARNKDKGSENKDREPGKGDGAVRSSSSSSRSALALTDALPTKKRDPLFENEIGVIAHTKSHKGNKIEELLKTAPKNTSQKNLLGKEYLKAIKVFNGTNSLGLNDKIIWSGFVDALEEKCLDGEDEALEALVQGGLKDEWRVIRFDSSVVAALSGTVLGFLKPLLDASTSLEARYITVALVVAKFFPFDDDMEIFKPFFIALNQPLDSFDVIRVRSLVFKFLCERSNLNAALKRKRFPSSDNENLSSDGFFYYNEISLKGQSFLVDLFRSVGSLFPTDMTDQYIKSVRSMAKSNLEYDKELTVFLDNKQKEREAKGSDSTSSVEKAFRLPGLETAEVELLMEIGKGRFGKVYQAKLGGFICAAKVVNMSALNASERKAIDREIDLLFTLPPHRNVLQIFGNIEVGGEMTIFSELWSTSLKSVIQSIVELRRPPFSRSEIKLILRDVIAAVDHLHQQQPPVIHRDLKSGNVLVDISSSGVRKCCLCDFGVSKTIDPTKPLIESVGTARWMAPEVHQNREYNERADVWSFGMFALELMTLKLPYDGVIVLDIKQAQHDLRLPTMDLHPLYSTSSLPPGSLSEYAELSTIIKSCLEFDAKKRPSAAEVRKLIESSFQ